MTRTPKPAPERTPEQALERLRQFTRALAQVPKSDVVPAKKRVAQRKRSK